MILDKGICTIFRKTDTAAAGGMPTAGYTRIYASWYGEMNFETSPVWQTEGREENRADARIRILQNREIRQNDVAVLADVRTISAAGGKPAYKITRAYHGDDGPTQITDLTLEVVTP